MTYPDTDRLADARARYFTDNGFPSDGGYSARWVRIALGPVPVYIYNSASRVRGLNLPLWLPPFHEPLPSEMCPWADT